MAGAAWCPPALLESDIIRGAAFAHCCKFQWVR
ncbi:hypothetical protein CBM2634_A80147 [Cupriavidus taiwanensis]|uniref:Uncharacterized protein n=1 Tax=Cupriavidus taiwanensis TaxID=164546 RepID=A0A375J207_9BURK|nr:hypothetical protein CBM2634_A80147 [Cupriavidus taiwanensis]